MTVVDSPSGIDPAAGVPPGSLSLRTERAVTMAAVAALTTAWGLLMPKGRAYRIDHQAALDVLAQMRSGAGYYPAFRDTFLNLDVRLGSVRAFRTPFLFLLWRLFPGPWLYPLFLTVVVGGTSAALVFAARRPLVVVPVALFLLIAGRSPGTAPQGVEGWLLVEAWTVPMLAVSYLAWRRQRWWWAAVMIGLAVLTREIYLPVLLAGAGLAWWQRRPLRPWVASGSAVAGLYLLHAWRATQASLPNGTEAQLWGTGTPPGSMLGMMSWAVEWPAWIAVAVWGLAAWWLWRTRALSPMVILLLYPLAGIWLDRGYWGTPAIAFALLWAGEGAPDLAKAGRAHNRSPLVASSTHASGEAPLSTERRLSEPMACDGPTQSGVLHRR